MKIGRTGEAFGAGKPDFGAFHRRFPDALGPQRVGMAQIVDLLAEWVHKFDRTGALSRCARDRLRMVAVGAVAERLHGPTVVGAKVASGAGRADWESLVGVGWPQPQPGLVGLGVAWTGRGELHRPFGSGS